MMQPTSTRNKLLISAFTHGGVHLFCHCPDHFAGHSLLACRLLITYPCMFISSSSLAFFLPPPGSLALFCPLRTDAEAQFYFFTNLSLREMSSGCFSWVFLCTFYNRKFEFQVVLFIFLLHQSHGHQSNTDWQKPSKTHEKGEEEKHAVSLDTSSFLIKKINK